MVLGCVHVSLSPNCVRCLSLEWVAAVPSLCSESARVEIAVIVVLVDCHKKKRASSLFILLSSLQTLLLGNPLFELLLFGLQIDAAKLGRTNLESVIGRGRVHIVRVDVMVHPLAQFLVAGQFGFQSRSIIILLVVILFHDGFHFFRLFLIRGILVVVVFVLDFGLFLARRLLGGSLFRFRTARPFLGTLSLLSLCVSAATFLQFGGRGMGQKIEQHRGELRLGGHTGPIQTEQIANRFHDGQGQFGALVHHFLLNGRFEIVRLFPTAAFGLFVVLVVFICLVLFLLFVLAGFVLVFFVLAGFVLFVRFFLVVVVVTFRIVSVEFQQTLLGRGQIGFLATKYETKQRQQPARFELVFLGNASKLLDNGLHIAQCLAAAVHDHHDDRALGRLHKIFGLVLGNGRASAFGTVIGWRRGGRGAALLLGRLLGPFDILLGFHVHRVVVIFLRFDRLLLLLLVVVIRCLIVLGSIGRRRRCCCR
mmetsp:Transcript_11768/g.32597  ORF Transcript_11768/g.32597 Transcript_11768/m.32597 type:complete len:479 (+) Transcript_11768:73-1509(+)